MSPLFIILGVAWPVRRPRPSSCMEAVARWSWHRVRHVHSLHHRGHLLQRGHGLLPPLHVLFIHIRTPLEQLRP